MDITNQDILITPKVGLNSETRVSFFLLAVNALIFSAYLAFEPLAPEVFHQVCLIGGALILLSGAGALLGGKLGKFLRSVQFFLLQVAITMAAVHLLFVAFPQYWPANVRNLVMNQNLDELRSKIVEYLPRSPYVKPAPNVSFIIPGYYGPADGFEYQFVADQRGFKNLREIASRSQFDVVAVGDSFTEGLGVSAQQTYVTNLTRRGLSAYSLGIQGYAPAQMAGAFREFGLALKPKYVVVGYLANIYHRDKFFRENQKNLEEVAEVPGAVGRLIERDRIAGKVVYIKTKEGYSYPVTIKQQYRFLPTALIALASEYVYFYRYFDLKKGVGDLHLDVRFNLRENIKSDDLFVLPQLAAYKAEALNALNRILREEDLARDPNWQSTLGDFQQIIEDARKIGAKVILVMFHTRDGIYYEAGTGRRLPADFVEKSEVKLLREFAKRQQVEFLDTQTSFMNYIGRLNKEAPLSVMPYLKVDAHPSPVGHKLIADLIFECVEQMQRGRRCP